MVLGAVLVCQLILGPVMVIRALPLALATAHNAVAALLLLAVVAPEPAAARPTDRLSADSGLVPVESQSAVETPSIQHPHASWRDYYELGKPRVVMLIMFTAIAGMFLAAPGFPPPNALVFGTLGIALAASAAAAVNHVLDRRFDAQMARTRNRPLPQGHLTQRQALTYAAILGVLSMLLLWGWVNPLTAVLTILARCSATRSSTRRGSSTRLRRTS